MNSPIQAIRTTSIRYAVADAIRSSLREGLIKPGEDLSEVDLAQRFEVSRGPIREALLVLVEEGLLNHSPNRGFSVVNLTSEDMKHITDIRLLLESHALFCARDRVTPADLAKLSQIKDELISLFEDNQRPARDAKELAFHSFIWRLSGNPWLEHSLARVMIPYFTFSRHLGVTRVNLDKALAAKQHQLYLDYLTRKNDYTAEQCVRFHLALPPV